MASERMRPGRYTCGLDAAMGVVGGKWKVMVIWALTARPGIRFGELQREIPGITVKVLASHLKELEEDGIVRRVAYAEVPPRVEYFLTDAGIRLNAALAPLGAWGTEHILGDTHAPRSAGVG
ncbi:winged helix-turn-helix transcriptional regulator [Yinghuangia seranimata]|uniref:winged helix-turn-helix transcriptional regulator n=1 Tax=Yinghuangia seranimata TaxID=408067 RepID=UPI00248AAA06|nr:helix-turn-helix domain-containing protein [Yinghuangia seranimata]MDI2127854.1 helix-turn-helix domain-containing protein [Yinghuangia seranimata]